MRFGTIRFRAEEGKGSEPDLSTDAGFAAHQAEKLGVEISDAQMERLESTDRNVLSGLTYDESPQPRDDQGRFAQRESAAQDEGKEVAQEEQPEAPEAQATTEQEEQPEPSPVEKQLVDAQSFIGKQSETIGELRARLEALEKQRSEQPREEPEYAADLSEYSQVSDLVYENGGIETIEYLTQIGRADLLDHAVNEWVKADPENALPQARVYWQERAKQEAAAQGQPAPQPQEQQPQQQLDPYLAQVREREIAQARIGQAAAKVGEGWNELVPHFSSALDAAPQLAVAAMRDGSEEALDGLIEIARAKQITAGVQAANEQRQEQATQAKQAARVAPTGQRPSPAVPSAPPSEEDNREERLAEFHRRFREAPTTSVSESLVFGNESR